MHDEQAEEDAPHFRDVADYKPDSEQLLNGNVMAAVQPRPESNSDILARLHYPVPERDSDFFDRPLHERLEYLHRMDEFHYVFPEDIYAYRSAIALIRKSFLPRDPRRPDVRYMCMEAAHGRFRGVPRLSEVGGGGALGMILTGITGSGKSCFVDRLCSAIGTRAWRHFKLGDRSCRWLQLAAVRVKVKPTYKDTLLAIVQAIDYQLKQNYYAKRENNATRGRYENTVLASLTCHFAPILILEDIEKIDSLGAEAVRILNGLVDIMEAAGIVVLIVGTVAVHRLFKQYSMQFAKLSAGGEFSFPLLKPDADSDEFIRELKGMSVSVGPIQYSDDFNHQLRATTMGVRRITRDYLRAVLTRHAYDERTVADGKLLKSISIHEMAKYQESLGILRQVKLGIDPRFDQHQRYEHFLPPDRTKLTQEEWSFLAKEAAKFDKLPSDLTHVELTAEAFLALQQGLAEVRTRQDDKGRATEASGKQSPGKKSPAKPRNPVPGAPPTSVAASDID